MSVRWKVSTLGQACDIKPPKKEAKARLSATDLVSFVPMNDLSVREKDFSALQKRPLKKVAGSYTYFVDGDVLLAKITPCFENGKLGVARSLTNGVGFGSSEFIVFRPADWLDSEYLFYYLSQDSFRDSGASVMSGAVGHKRVPKEFIENYPIPLPLLPEQKRIVAILDEAFAGIATAVANAGKNLANARELFEGHLQAVVGSAYQTGTLVTLADLAIDITDGDHMPPPKSETGVPFITISNVRKDTRTIDFSNTFKVPQKYFDDLKASKKPKEGDVLYTVTGSFGIPVLIREGSDFCFQRHIGLVRPKPEVLGDWLYYLLMSPQVFRQASEGATGTAQKTVSLRVLRGFQVPRFSLARQTADVAYLDVLSTETQRLESIYGQKLTALAELKQSLLQKAFSGELTAAPEPLKEEDVA